MKRKLVLYLGIVLVFVFALLAISAVAAIREVGAAVRESLPEIANQYLIVEGLPAEPSETVIQYYQALDEDQSRFTWPMILFIVFAVAVTVGLLAFLVIGPEGMSGLLRQKRLLMLREGRGAGSGPSRPPQRRDDEWMETAWRQQAQAALPAIAPPPSTPWLLPAPAAREGEDDAR